MPTITSQTALTCPSTPGAIGTLSRYEVSNNTRVLASGTGVTTVATPGVLNVFIPNNVEVLQIITEGIFTDPVLNLFTINVVYAWDNNMNTSNTNISLSNITVWDLTLIETGGAAIELLPDPVPRTLTRPASNQFRLVFENLSIVNRWGVTIGF